MSATSSHLGKYLNDLKLDKKCVYRRTHNTHIRPTIFLKVDLDLVRLCAGGSGPRLPRLLFGPRGDVTPVETSVGQLDARQAKPKLCRARLRQNQAVSERTQREKYISK